MRIDQSWGTGRRYDQSLSFKGGGKNIKGGDKITGENMMGRIEWTQFPESLPEKKGVRATEGAINS